VLFEEGLDAESLFALADEDQVRAVARDITGAGLVFLYDDSQEGVAGAVDRLRVTEGRAAQSGLLIPIPPLPVAVGHLPAPCTLFASVLLDRGRQHDYGRHLQGIGPAPEGYEQAAALVLGCDQAHALLEVVGPEWLVVLERLDLLTAHEDVLDVRTLPVAPEQVRGAGSRLAWGP
jgi:hypothetical protein